MNNQRMGGLRWTGRNLSFLFFGDLVGVEFFFTSGFLGAMEVDWESLSAAEEVVLDLNHFNALCMEV